MITLLIFLATYLVLAVGRLPWLRIDRPGAALIGASLMVATDAIPFDDALASIDFRTLALLLGMMIVVANLRLAGFFRVAAAFAIRSAHGPVSLLAGVVFASGILSALFVNDTICLVLTPIVLEVALALHRNPVPYLLGVAMGSNCGSVATITGNPQNMMIGSLSSIPYAKFAAALTPVALVSLALTVLLLTLFYRQEFGSGFQVEPNLPRVRVNRVLLLKALLTCVGMMVFFFLGWPVARVAIVAGALLLITRRVNPSRVYAQIDWPLLLMFAGLFIVVESMERSAYGQALVHYAEHLGMNTVGTLTVWSALLSNLLSNVPAVLVFRPIVAAMSDPSLGWITLAMSSTLAGNLTLVGSVANLIVVQQAKGQVKISFWDYTKVGLPLGLLTLLCGVFLLEWWQTL